MKNILFVLIMMLAAVTTLRAQPYQIRAVNKGGGNVGVEVKITVGTPPTTADYVTDMVFGLKWLASYNVDLENTLTSDYHVTKSGTRQTKGIWHYQAFFADQTAFLFPANWVLDTWVEVLTVKNTLNGGTATGTFEIAEVGFDATTQPNLGVGTAGNVLSDYTPAVVGSATVVPLPVNLTRFEASPRQNHIFLQWVTVQEQNAKGFEVERADQANPAVFTRLKTIASKGSAGGTYEYADHDVTGGVKYYYRLKQVDLDDRFRYSETRTAMLDESANTLIQLWPNPVEKELQVTMDGITAQKVLIKVTDARGRVVMVRDYQLSTGRKTTLNVASLGQGQYFLSVESNKTVLGVKPFVRKGN